MVDLRRPLIALLLAAVATTAIAQDQSSRPQSGPGVLSLLPGDAVTEHSIDLPSGKLAYTATAGTFALFDQSGERSAEIFYTAFVAKSPKPETRPITFVFNGGPGAASAFLNLGVVGPRIAEFGTNGQNEVSQAGVSQDGVNQAGVNQAGVNHDGSTVHLVDNPETWLAFTDLVLIDPVGTGWSRPAKPDGSSAFWNVHNDAESMAKVIALYVAKNARTSSPKYILGESYGGFRAAKVARVLRNDQGIGLSGIVMLSPLLEGAFEFGGERFALGAALQFPSLAAAELERKGTFSKDALAQAEHFALTDYLSTLAGPPPQGDAANKFYARVAAMTGMPVDVVAKTHGFIRETYIKNFDAAAHKIVSRYDATFASDDPFPESPVPRGPDPILDGVIRSYGSAFASYARDELGFKTVMTYNLLDAEIANKWDWGDGGRAQASAADDLRVSLALSPSFRLLIGQGYSDMIIPYSDSRYVLDHLPAMDGKERAELKLYRGGHMFYLDPASRKAFTDDARAMYPTP